MTQPGSGRVRAAVMAVEPVTVPPFAGLVRARLGCGSTGSRTEKPAPAEVATASLESVSRKVTTGNDRVVGVQASCQVLPTFMGVPTSGVPSTRNCTDLTVRPAATVPVAVSIWETFGATVGPDELGQSIVEVGAGSTRVTILVPLSRVVPRESVTRATRWFAP